MKNYFVYMHIFPNNKKYIGITCRKPTVRWNNGRGYSLCKRMNNAILKYGWDNVRHDILHEKLTKEEAEQKEIEYIKFYKTQDIQCGYNILPGGELGRDGLRHSQETKDKMGIAWKHRVVSEETKRKMSEAHMGQVHSVESFAKMKATIASKPKKIKLVKEKVTSGWGRNILQIDLTTNEVIKKWNNTKEICTTLGIAQAGISRACSGKYDSYKGFRWEYVKK